MQDLPLLFDMGKLSVLFFAALAFQAAFGGLRYEDDTLGGDLRWVGRRDVYEKYDDVFVQLDSYFQNFELYFQKTSTTDDRFFYKTLLWQSREIAQYVDVLINKLQTVVYKYEGELSTVLVQVIEELRQIQTILVRFVGQTQVYNVDEIKTQFLMTFKNLFVQIQKLWRLVETNVEFNVIIKDIVYDFLYFFKNFRTNFQYFGVYGEQTPKQLVYQIQEVTSGLVQYLQGYDYVNSSYHMKLALRNYVYYIEAILVRMRDFERTFSDAVFQQLYHKLQRVYYVVMQIVDGEIVGNFDYIKVQLVQDLEVIAQYFERLVQSVDIDVYQTLIREILGDYCYAIQRFRYYVQPGYKGIWGLEGFWGKYGYNKFDGLWGQTYNKFQGLPTYGQDIRGLKIKYEKIVRDLLITLETITVDDVTTRQTLLRYIREYTRELEMIVQWLEQSILKVNYDVYYVRELVQELQQILFRFQQLYTVEYNTISTVELKERYFVYIRKFLTLFDKLFDIDAQDTFYTLVQEVLFRYVNITYQFYYRLQQIPRYGIVGNDYAYGYGGEVDKCQKIRLIVKDLYWILQKDTVYKQETLVMYVRYFVQLLKDILLQLEQYQRIELVREVVYEIRQVYTVLERLTVSDTFTDVQLKMEFYKTIQIVLRQFEKLQTLIREDVQGDQLRYVIESVFDLFFNGLYEIYRKFQGLDVTYGYGKTFSGGFDETFKGFGKDLQLSGSYTKGYGLEGIYGYGKMPERYGNTLYNKYFY